MPQTSSQSLSIPDTLAPVPMLDLKRQYDAIRDEIHAAIERVLTTQYFIGGPELDAFEREAAAYLGAKYALGCASGTDALWLALEAGGVDAGSAVLTTPFSFFATASSITRCGATPLFADIDPATLNIDPAHVESAIAEGRVSKLRAIMPVHLYGQCADMDALSRICSAHKLALVEDAAQAFGASWRGKKAGTLGDASGFSFYPSKNLSAYGDGGAVTTNDAGIAARVCSLRNHGSNRRYYHEEIGWNSRLDAMQAAVLCVKLRHIDEWNGQRRAHAAHYDAKLAAAGLTQVQRVTVDAQAPVALLQTRPEAHHIYHQYAVRAFRRDQLRDFLSSQHIATEVYYPVPLHLQQSFAYLGYKEGDMPESERAAREIVALPMFPELRDDEQTRVVEAIAEFYTR